LKFFVGAIVQYVLYRRGGFRRQLDPSVMALLEPPV